jgi:hypothetical protein
MRVTASRAYIAGIGTTGVLIGFALLILAVVSALVAFRGWPGDAVVGGAGEVDVGDNASLVGIEPVRLGERARAADGRATSRAGAATAGSRRAGGRFDVRGVSQSESARLQPGSAPVGAPGANGTGTPNGTGSPNGTGTPSVPPPASPGGGGMPGGVTEGPAGAVGETVGPVTGGLPDAGGVVGGSVPSIGDVQQKAGELGLP